MQVVMNRLYICFYINYESAWIDIGKAINKYVKDYSVENQDYTVVGNTLKEAVIFLYIQWYILSLARFKIVK